MGAFDDLPDAPGFFKPEMAQGRSRFSSELADPNVYSAFNQRIANEVGGQTPEEQQAFVESVMNRASARKQALRDVVNDRSYFPSQSFRPRGDVDYSMAITSALKGSNVANSATGNESGNVRSGGAPITKAGAGGERFVVENQDAAFPFQDLPGKSPFDDLPQAKEAKATAPVAAPAPAVAPTPQEQSTLADRVKQWIPDTLSPEEEVAATKNPELQQLIKGLDVTSIPRDVLENLTPLPGAYHQLHQAYDVLRGVPVEQAIPESQQFVGIEQKPLEERIKTGLNTAIQLAFAKEIGKQVIPQAEAPVITPGRTAADIEAQARAEPAGPQAEVKPGTIADDVSRALKPEPVTTGDVTRAILDKRNPLVAEAQQLQQQADISRAATGQVHPAVEQRIAEINQQLNQPETTPGIADMIRQQTPTLAEKIKAPAATAPEPTEPAAAEPVAGAQPQPITAELPTEAAKPPVQTEGLPESGISTERLQKIYGDDAVTITKGKSAKAWKAIGAADPRDPYAVLSQARDRGIATPADAAKLRDEHQRLLEAARQAYGTPEYNARAQNALDFANATKEVAHGPASDIFRGLQEVDKPRYDSPADFDNILRERLKRESNPVEKKTFEDISNELKNGDAASQAEATKAQSNLSRYRPKEVVSFDDAAASVRKQIEELTKPCPL